MLKRVLSKKYRKINPANTIKIRVKMPVRFILF